MSCRAEFLSSYHLESEMKPFAFALFACLCLVAPNFADDTKTAKPRTPGADGAKSLAEQLKTKPDDRSLFDKYMIKNLSEVRLLISTDPDKAKKQLAVMRKLVESLEPETDDGKNIVLRAKQVIQGYKRQVERHVQLSRVTLEELTGKLKENPDDTKTISMYGSKLMVTISPLTRTEPHKAEELLNSADELLATIVQMAQQDAAKKAIAAIGQSFASLEEEIETGKRLAALVGADAARLEVEAWVNGDPLTEGDLKGKVVLLDFWSVWCGPCISTFPHLREWHEKYANQGLVIVGLTRYYNYTWDDTTGRPKRVTGDEKVTPEQEQEMLSKFAEHHNLPYRLAIQKDRSLSDYYAVSGIPHVVVICREGKIRLIRIGSGEENARDISEMIEQLIADV
jgi:thiol-disulfide isomerase/thioredoxin